MTADEFLMQARTTLTPNPFDRLSPATKLLVEQPNCIFDAHTHIFDRNCVPIPYIALRMLKERFGYEPEESMLSDTENFSDPVFNKTEEDWYKYISENRTDNAIDQQKLTDTINRPVTQNQFTNEHEGLEGLLSTLNVLAKNNKKAVFEHFYNGFSLKALPQYKKNPFVAVVLMMDLETGWNQTLTKPYIEQVRELKTLMNEKPILPFFAIDPRRADIEGEGNLYRLFLEAFEPGNSFFGVKCYPSLGYFPNDKRLDPIFKICAEMNIPVTTHCGGETVSTFAKQIKIDCPDKTEKQFVIPGEKRKDRARFLNDPKQWCSVVEKYPNLRLNLAHFACDWFWQNRDTDTRVDDIIKLLCDPKYQVYTDFAFNLIDPTLFRDLKKVVEQHQPIQKRLMFGTDYWVVLPHGDLIAMKFSFLERFGTYRKAFVADNVRAFLFGNK